MKTYLEFNDEKSAKFWQIELEGNTHTVTYGKTGTKGTSKTKEFDNDEAAQKDAEKLIASKTKKGYKVVKKQNKTPEKKMKTNPAPFQESLDHLLEKLFKGKAPKVCPLANEYENNYQLPFSDDLKKLLSGLLKTSLYYSEWKCVPDEIVCFSENEKENRFEQLILSDQANFLGIALLEVFTNSAFIGRLGNGDYYLANMNALDKDAPKGEIEIVVFDHETFDIDIAFADSLGAMAEANSLLNQLHENENGIDEKEFSSKVKKLKKHLNLTWHFKQLEEISEITPEFDSKLQAKFLLYRSWWLISLFRQDGVTKMADIPELFSLVKQPPANEEAVQNKFKDGDYGAVSSIYWMWYFFFMGQDEAVKKHISLITENTPSLLIRDAALLLLEVLEGRKEIGKIKDIHKLRNEFMALVLNREQKKAEKKETRRPKKEDEIANKLIKENDLKALPEIAWDYISKPAVVERIFDYLRENDESLAVDFMRFDYIKNEKHRRNGKLYDFEIDEIYTALFTCKSPLSPLLYIHGYMQAANHPRAVVYALESLSKCKSTEDFTYKENAMLELLQKIPSDKTEEVLFKFMPPVSENDDLIANMNIEEDLKKMVPVLANIGSPKVIPELLKHINTLEKRMQDKEKDGSLTNNALRAKGMLNEEVLPLLILSVKKSGNSNNAKHLLPYKETALGNAVIEAFIELGDKEVAKELQTKGETITGDPVKLIYARMLTDYALHKAGEKVTTENAEFALRVAMDERKQAQKLHLMAVEIIGKHHKDKKQAVKLLLPLLTLSNIK